jgi:hypothetical protein
MSIKLKAVAEWWLTAPSGQTIESEEYAII